VIVFEEEVRIELEVDGIPRVGEMGVKVFWRRVVPIGRSLCVYLTDEADLSVLYCLEMTEMDFRRLKVEQSLVVEFHSFADKLVELVQRCCEGEGTVFRLVLRESGSGDGHPMAGVVGPTGGSAGKGTSSQQATASGSGVRGVALELAIVETNRLKNLTHLALGVRRADDEFMRLFLATRLRRTIALSSQATRTKDQTEKELVDLTAKYDDMKSKWEQATESEQRYAKEIARLKLEQTSLQQDLAAERLRASSAVTEVQDFRGRVADQDRIRKKLSESEELCQSMQQEVVEFQAKEQLLKQNLKELLGASSSSADVSSDEAVKQLTIWKQEREAELNSYKSQVSRLNEEVASLQKDLFAIRQKLRTKTVASSRLEQLLNESKARVETLAEEIRDLKNKESEETRLRTDLEESLRKANSRIQEKEEKISCDRKIISWLNRELNDCLRAGFPRSSSPHSGAIAREITSNKSAFDQVQKVHGERMTPRT